MPVAEYVRRLKRSRDWHLYQAGAARIRMVDVAKDIQAHEREAANIDGLIRDAVSAAAPTPPDSGGEAA